MPRDIFGCHSLGAASGYLSRTMLSTLQCTGRSLQQKLTWLKTSILLRLRNQRLLSTNTRHCFMCSHLTHHLLLTEVSLFPFYRWRNLGYQLHTLTQLWVAALWSEHGSDPRAQCEHAASQFPMVLLHTPPSSKSPLEKQEMKGREHQVSISNWVIERQPRIGKAAFNSATRRGQCSTDSVRSAAEDITHQHLTNSLGQSRLWGGDGGVSHHKDDQGLNYEIKTIQKGMLPQDFFKH